MSSKTTSFVGLVGLIILVCALAVGVVFSAFVVTPLRHVSPANGAEPATTDTSRRLVSAEEAEELIKRVDSNLYDIEVAEKIDLSGTSKWGRLDLEGLKAGIVDISNVTANQIILTNTDIRVVVADRARVNTVFSSPTLGAHIHCLSLKQCTIKEALVLENTHLNTLFLNGALLPYHMNLVFADPPKCIYVDGHNQAERVHFAAPNVPLLFVPTLKPAPAEKEDTNGT